MAGSDVRVRLSAEGVAEVIAALRKVGGEAKRTQQEAAGGAGLFKKALDGVGRGLAAVGAAVTVGAIINFARSASEMADQIGKASQRVGASVENMSALNYIANEADVSLGKLQSSMAKFAKVSTEAQGGIETSARAFAAIGITRAELAKFDRLDTAEQLDRVAKSFAAMETGPRKSAAAIALFGRSGAELLPLLNDLGTRGLGEVRKAADDLGVLLTGDMTNAVAGVNDSMARMGLQAKVLAANMVTGMAPSFQQAMAAVSASMKGGGRAWDEFGKIVGFIVKVIVVGATLILSELAHQIKTIADVIGTLVRVASRAVKGDWEGARRAISDGQNLLLKNQQKHSQQMFDIVKSWNAKTDTERKASAESEVVDLDAMFRERADILRYRLEAEQRARDAANKLAERQADEMYQAGLRSVSQYYARRRAIVEQAVADEVANIQERIAAERDNPDVNIALQNIAKLEAMIQQVRDEGATAVSKLASDELKERERLADAVLELENQVLEAKGRTHEVAMRNLQAEVEKRRVDLAQTDLSAGQRAALLREFQETMTAAIRFQEVTDRATQSFARFDAEVADIQRLVNAGLLSQIEGERRILAVTERRIAALRRQAEAARQAAQTPEQREAADRIGQQADDMAVTLEAAVNFGAKFQATIQDAVTGQIEWFFTDGIQGAQSFSDAMRQMAQSVIQSLQRLAAQFLATRIAMALLGWFNSSSSASLDTGPIALPGLPAPIPVTRASGGLIHGVPGIDRNLALLTRGEYVVRSGVVGRPGVLSFLERLNAGMISPRALPRFAAGGMVGKSRFEGSMTVGLEPGLLVREINSPAGRDAVLRVVARNPRTMRSAMGG